MNVFLKPLTVLEILSVLVTIIMTKYCSTKLFEKLSIPIIPSVPPKISKASIILAIKRGYISVAMAKYTPFKGRHGRSMMVDKRAPKSVARGMETKGGKAK